MSNEIFISHSSKDDAFVKELRQTLELFGQKTWVDSRELTAGEFLKPTLEKAIREANFFLLIVSNASLDSEWVEWELETAQDEAANREGPFKIVPILLPNTPRRPFLRLFEHEPIYIQVEDRPDGFQEILPDLFASLGMTLSNDRSRGEEVKAEPFAELILELTTPEIKEAEGTRRATAIAKLSFSPSDRRHTVDSKSFRFTSPLSPLEKEEIKWYIERYYQWPTGVFKDRAQKTEANLQVWGKALFDSVFGSDSAKKPLNAMLNSTEPVRFSVQIDFDALEEASEAEQADVYESASELLSLPWEIMHDEEGFLSHEENRIRIRRRLPKRSDRHQIEAKLPIRVLLISPRPEIDKDGNDVGYINHRVIAEPLINAMESLGEGIVQIDILDPPTFPAMRQALKKAKAENSPYEIVHFDGHGVYDHRVGLGALCFEDPKDKNKLEKRLMQLVYAEKKDGTPGLADELRHYGVPLMCLNACQSALSIDDPQASVAVNLLNKGVGSVVAMTHTVLVETARRFVEAFYTALANGLRVGDAMLAGQSALYDETYRFKIMGAGDLELSDWFVPVLYQQADDPQLFTHKPGEDTLGTNREKLELKLGRLPTPPPHSFIGRSRMLLHLERLLTQTNYAVIRGSGGLGKTALANELARWLVRSGRFERAAFVSVETQNAQNVDAIIDTLGKQLVGESYIVAQYRDLTQKLLPIQRALNDFPTILLFDNMESVLPDHEGVNPAGAADVTALLAVCQQLLDFDTRTRLIFTTRERLIAPFDGGQENVELSRLSQPEAIQLVERVMAQEGWQPPANDSATTPEEIAELVETVNRHPRALVLLAREVANGVRATTQNLAKLMGQLEASNKGDRENSLYASVELSLRRLPPEMRPLVNHLAVFHGGGHIVNMAAVMGIEVEQAGSIAAALIETGMAEYLDYNYLRFDPALPAYLRLGQDGATLAEWEAGWGNAMVQLVDFLYSERTKDAKLALNLTLFELPNLLHLLTWLEGLLTADPANAAGSAERVADTAGSIEQLLATLNRPTALVSAVAVREAAAQALPEWGNAAFQNERLQIERMLQQGALQPAYEKAQALLTKAEQAGPEAYPGADYDLAMAFNLLGQVLGRAGQAELALPLFEQAQARFEALPDDRGAPMAAVQLTQQADCLEALGKLDEAAKRYRERIKRGEQQDDPRGVAVGRNNLGEVLRRQQKFAEALEEINTARDIFSSLNELVEVAVSWHKIGMVQAEAGNLAEAEKAYRQALEIFTQIEDEAKMASSLGELGNFYDSQLNRPEQAITFYRQAADIYVRLGDTRYEGVVRNNIAHTLFSLGRHDEARSEIERAIECKQELGHAGTVWNTFNILHDIETAAGNAQAARAAWQQARSAYLAYRQQGGYAPHQGGQLCDQLLPPLQNGDGPAIVPELKQMSESPQTPEFLKALIPHLIKICNGSRDTALADDPTLDYDDAAEILFLIQRLSA